MEKKEKEEQEEKKEVKKGKFNISKVITVMLGVALFCVFSIFGLALLDNGSKSKQQQKPSDKETPSQDNSAYYGKYIAVSQTDSEIEEYFILNEDGTATVYTIDGEGFLEVTTRYTISTENGKKFLKFEEYDETSPGNWYTYAVELNGKRAIPSGYNANCTGPSTCDISFEKSN